MAKPHVYAAGSTASVVILLTRAAAGEAEVLKKARGFSIALCRLQARLNVLELTPDTIGSRRHYESVSYPPRDRPRMRNCRVNDPRGSLGHPSAKSSYDRIDPFGMTPVSERPHGGVIAHPMTPGLLAI